MSDNENEQNLLSEGEEETEIAVKVKQTSSDQFDCLTQMFTTLEVLDTEYNEKRKEFEKVDKEYNLQRKKQMRDIEQYMKKFGKTFKLELSKNTKVRKTGNSGKGGFNKLIPVPSKLREYLGLANDVLMSRPQVTHMLNDKFKEEKFRSEENGKVIKITNKKSAKILGCDHNKMIQFNEFQGFIASFYNEMKLSNQTNITQVLA